MKIGAVEAGGTKFVCGIGNEFGEILERVTFPTTTPEETLKKVVEFFRDKNIERIGIGSFGPIDVNKNSPTYGYITKTPKLKWTDCDIVGYMKKHLGVPIYFDTDVNGAVLGEAVWGSAKGLDSSIYITIGTGIGGGALVGGKLVHGMLHPEMGHIIIKRHPEDEFEGNCPFHRDCFEGLASGPAIEKRWGISGDRLDITHKAWDIEAYYIAQGVVNFILTMSPQKIILGGGVMKQRELFPKIRKNVVDILNGYVQTQEIIKNIDEYIVPPKLGDNAGLLGAVALCLE